MMLYNPTFLNYSKIFFTTVKRFLICGQLARGPALLIPSSPPAGRAGKQAWLPHLPPGGWRLQGAVSPK